MVLSYSVKSLKMTKETTRHLIDFKAVKFFLILNLIQRKKILLKDGMEWGWAVRR